MGEGTLAGPQADLRLLGLVKHPCQDVQMVRVFGENQIGFFRKEPPDKGFGRLVGIRGESFRRDDRPGAFRNERDRHIDRRDDRRRFEMSIPNADFEMGMRFGQMLEVQGMVSRVKLAILPRMFTLPFARLGC